MNARSSTATAAATPRRKPVRDPAAAGSPARRAPGGAKPSRRDGDATPRTRQSPPLEVVGARPGWVQVIGPLALTSVFAVLLLMAVFHALIVQGQRELDRLTGEITEAQLDNDRLLLELAEKEAPERIVAAARAFGMVDAPEVVYLSPENNGPATVDDETDAPS